MPAVPAAPAPTTTAPPAPDPAPPPAVGAPFAAATTPPPDAPLALAPLRKEWAERYGIAKALLVEGHFAEANDALSALLRDAATPEERRLAAEFQSVVERWLFDKKELVLSHDLEDSTLTARRENRRTTDEISFLYVNGVAYGVGTGVFLAVAGDANSPASVILPSLLLGGAGAGAVAIIDHGKGLGYGVPQSIVSGMYLGLEEGLVWSLWNQAHVAYYDEWKPGTVAGIVWGSATLGAIGGGIVGTLGGTTPGRASYVESTGLWTGVVSGLLAGATVKREEQADEVALLTGAIGLNAGALVGVLTAGTVSPSIARVRFIDLGAVGGGLVLGGLYVAAADRDTKPGPAMTATALGVAAGFGGAWFLTSGMRKDRPASRAADTASGPVPIGMSITPTNGGAAVTAYGQL
jgi:hypothetical protein